MLGDVVEKVYQNNIKTEDDISSSHLFQQTISVERELESWRADLPLQLRVRTKDEIAQHLSDPSIFSPLSTVITLRYHSVRSLLHRAMVTRFLACTDQDDIHREDWNFLQAFGRVSLEVSVRSASETIDIIHLTCESPHRILTTWWFLVYYSKSFNSNMFRLS